jgi:imidazolonepropionase-like amidohydrolase
VDVARRNGMPTAAHVLSSAGAQIAIDAGVKTLEHGIGLTPSQLQAMRAGGQVLVPTLTPTHRALEADPDGKSHHIVRLRGLREILWASVESAAEIGVSMIAGTDAGCPHVPHGGVVDEIRLLERAGLSRRAALRAATSDAAVQLGLEHTGRVSVGHVADLLLLDGDPEDDLERLTRPVAVFANGRQLNGDL